MDNKIVTRQSLAASLYAADFPKRAQIIGRALVVLFNRQTAAEQAKNDTEVNNWIGFAACDAKQGSITAKTFLKNGTLLPFQVDHWMRTSRGFPYICKYHRQLNEAAVERARARSNKGAGA